MRNLRKGTQAEMILKDTTACAQRTGIQRSDVGSEEVERGR